MDKRRTATVLLLMTVALLACVSTTPLPPGSLAYVTLTPAPLPGNGREAAYAAAQATLTAGQSEMAALAHQATVVSLSMDQAADAAAQATRDDDQRQLMELSIRATEVSLNMAQAAATQHAIAEQNQMTQNATTTAQAQAAEATATAQSQAAMATARSQEATATYSAYVLEVTQTAQAQAVLDAHAAGTAQAHATLTAYPLTATPAAAMQAYIVRSRDQRERRALWDEFVVTPLTVILVVTVSILLIVGGVITFRRLLPIVEYRLRNPHGDRDRDMLPRSLTGVTVVDLDPRDYRLEGPGLYPRSHPQLVSEETPQVEVVDPDEPSVINWIAEAERKLRTDGSIQR